MERATKKRLKELRIKYDEDISDELASQLVWCVINQGKISNCGKNYCQSTVFNVNSTEYTVVANDKTKSTMFYVTKEDRI